MSKRNIHLSKELEIFLDALRIFSALIVLLSHTKEFVLIHHQNSSENIPTQMIRLLLSGGRGAVFVFFILSGYLVGGPLMKRREYSKDYTKKYILNRLTRLWQVLIPVLLITAVLNRIACNSSYSEYCSSSAELASALTIKPLDSQSFQNFASNVFFLAPFSAPIFGSNGPYWSLAYEFWYYAMFFSLFYLLNFLKQKFALKNLASTSIPILSGVLIFLCFGFALLNEDWLALSTLWLFGAILRNIQLPPLYLFRTIKGLRTRIFFALTFVILPTILLQRVFGDLIGAISLMVSFSISILFFAHDKQDVSKDYWLIRTSAQFSYSLYLLHFPLLGFLTTQLHINRMKITSASLSLVVALASMCVFCSWILAYFTEFRLEKFRNWLTRIFPKLA